MATSSTPSTTREAEAADGREREGESATEPTTRVDDEKATRDGDAEEEEEEEEEECGFCKYMKGGSCKEAFVAWEACVDAAKERGEDFVDVCFETTSALRDCMLLDPDYYGPMVGDEETAEEEGKVEKESDESTEVAEAKTA